jgi:hypothetical protein
MCIAGFTHAAPSAGDIKRDRNEISYLDKLDIASGLDDFTGDLVA